jgi:hypothetical protein
MRELLRISAEMKRSRPVFIVGEARSGTSILYRTLQKHSSFRPAAPNLVETEIFADLRRTFMFRPGYPEPLVRFMLDDAGEYARFLATIRIPRAVSALLIPLNLLVKDRSDVLWLANLSPLVVRSFFFHATRARRCRRLVEKTPTNTANLARLAACFPLARFLYIHRHPIDVFGSYRRRAADDPDARWAAALGIEDFCRSYGASTERALRWRERNGNLLMIAYEAFTSSPESEFDAVCAFLDEPVEAEALRDEHPDPGRWRGDPYLWDRIVPVTKDWRDFVSPGEVRAIQDRLGAMMSMLGYDRYDPAQGRR